MEPDVIKITLEEAWSAFLGRLEAAELTLGEYLWLKENACHINCVEFEDWRRKQALRSADTWFFMVGGMRKRQPEGLEYWGAR